MKKCLSVVFWWGLLTSLGLPLYLISSVSAQTLTVCENCELQNLQSAIDIADHGDTILLKGGQYTESNIIVDKSIYLLGENFPMINGGGSAEIMIVSADDVTIEGIQFQNVKPSYIKDLAALRLRKVSRATIKNNRFYDTFFGIYLEHCKKSKILGNELKGEAKLEMSSGNAVHLWYCTDIVIDGNYVTGHRDGIYLEFVENSSVTNNVSRDNVRYGLHFMFSNHDNYSNNVFERNGAGVAVMFSKFIHMEKNRFLTNWGESSYGLLLKEIYDAEIINNIFDQNCIAIFVEGSSRINYLRNQFRNNGWALKISGGCLDNKIYENTFVANSFDVSYNGGKNQNSFDGNYWADYSGYDLDRDNIGDVPYRPVKLFNYIVNQTPESVVLLRSLFVDLVNFAEKVNPLYTPKNVVDNQPLMKSIHD